MRRRCGIALISLVVALAVGVIGIGAPAHADQIILIPITDGLGLRILTTGHPGLAESSIRAGVDISGRYTDVGLECSTYPSPYFAVAIYQYGQFPTTVPVTGVPVPCPIWP